MILLDLKILLDLILEENKMRSEIYMEIKDLDLLVVEAWVEVLEKEALVEVLEIIKGDFFEKTRI